jgi:3-oxoacyl-[acyl-carrier protein] reductase
MKQRHSGSFVFITSAREARPEPGFAVPTTVRAATTAFAKALAKEVAPFGIQANVVAPNYLYSEMYYPKARFVDSAEGRDLIARTVPFGRLGQPEEVGALICFLASGKSPFTTGQVIHFTGGWS